MTRSRTEQEIRAHLRNTLGIVPTGLPEHIRAYEEKLHLANMTEFEKLIYYGTQLVCYVLAGIILIATIIGVFQ